MDGGGHQANPPVCALEHPDAVTCVAFSPNNRALVFFLFFSSCTVFPQQRKLLGSSAQISSGVCRCRSQEQVPEEGSGRFRRVPACAGVGSAGGFRRFRKVPAYAGVGSGGRFRKVPEGSGRFRKISEGSGVCWRRFRR